MAYLKEILAVCSTIVAITDLLMNGHTETMLGVTTFWGVLIGQEITARALAQKK